MIYLMLVGFAAVAIAKARSEQRSNVAAVLALAAAVTEARGIMAAARNDAAHDGTAWALRAAVTALVVVAGALAIAYARLERELKTKRFGPAFRYSPSLDTLARAIRVLTTQGYALSTLAIALTILQQLASGVVPHGVGGLVLAGTWIGLGVVVLFRRARLDGRRPVTLTLAGVGVALACMAML